jgi:hypothetical protein
LAEVACTSRGREAADWKFVYIAEAHAMDEWPIRSARFNRGRGAVVVEKQPTQAKERCELATRFARDFDFPSPLDSFPHIELFVDDPEVGDLFEKEYAAWPLRVYLIQDGVVEFIAEPKDCSYDLAVLELMKMLNIG